MIDAWTGRTPSPSEFDRPPGAGPVSGLVERIDAVATELREKTTNLFRTAGITISNTLMTLANNLRVEGTLTSTGPASFGGNTTVTGALSTTGAATFGGNTNVTGTFSTTGAATFGGNTNITGTLGVTGTANIDGQMNVTGDAVFSGNLAVPNGSITNAALANPVVIVGAAPATTGGWAVSTTSDAKASSVISVPAGYSRATVIAWANMHFMDSSPNGGWVRATIQGNGGAEMGGLANLQLGQSATHTLGLTGLSGGTIGVSCDVRASVATGGMSGRIAQITAIAFFQR